ncbi:hypothetical protein KQX54_013903 [Cotesia glomerata]|uniref:Uncharacterized protein n=1 Tax=Cotesia glomerata TaxID=32391 RepID=A0AAV7I2C7_COTGL|nr:hypothetical protein KQX54_013903 [Cotesia glomerata]
MSHLLVARGGRPTGKTSLLKKLILMRLREGDDVVKHITEFNETVKRLRVVKLEISQVEKDQGAMYVKPTHHKQQRQYGGKSRPANNNQQL